jgi:hypothetical protein
MDRLRVIGGLSIYRLPDVHHRRICSNNGSLCSKLRMVGYMKFPNNFEAAMVRNIAASMGVLVDFF